MEGTIAVVCGGPSAEAEVSRSSGRCVSEALRATYDRVRLVELDGDIVDALKRVGASVVMPVLHGPPGEDGSFQGLLEILDLPYVGSDVLASACAMDKVVAKRLFRSAGLPVAPDVVLRRDEVRQEARRRVLETLGRRTVVKPSRQGSAVGVLFAEDETSLTTALDEAFTLDETVVVEQRVVGREVTVAIIDTEGPRAFPIVEVRTPDGEWYDYEHRYTAGLSEHIIPAPLPERQYARTEEVAVAAHHALGCRDLSRVDFVVPLEGEPVLLEVNTLPGMTPTSLYPDAARAAGLSFAELVAQLVRAALRRGR